MKLNLVLNTFRPKGDKDRLKELQLCLSKNLENSLISNIYILHEDDEPYISDIQQKNPKVTLLKQQGRKTFGELFDFCRTNCKGITMLANSDIFFNNSLSRLHDIAPEINSGLVLAQHRYNLTSSGKIIYEKSPSKNNKFSGTADAWVFNPEIYTPSQYLKFLPGTSYCDQHLAMIFFLLQRPVLAAKDIECIHVHSSKINKKGRVQEEDYSPTLNIVKDNITNRDIKFVTICDTKEIKEVESLITNENKKSSLILEYLLQKAAPDRGWAKDLIEKTNNIGFTLSPHANHNSFPNAFYNLIPKTTSKEKIVFIDSSQEKITSKEAAIKKSLVIAVTASNISRTLKPLFDNILRYADLFKSTRVILTESDSNDTTVENVIQINNNIKNSSHTPIPIDFISLGSLKEMHPLRNERISMGRNEYLKLIDENYSSYDYALFLDGDEVNSEPISTEAILSNFSEEVLALNWDMICANSAYKYYDLWALRHPEWMPHDCHELLKNKPSFMSHQDAFNIFIKSKFIHIPTHTPPIKVDSAFGGAAFVKISSIKGVRHHYLNDKGKEFCEWVPFCSKLKNIYINPKFVIESRPNEHIWKNNAL